MGYGDYLMALGDASRQHHADPGKRPVAIGDGRTVEDPYPDLRFGLDFIATPELAASGAPVSWIVSCHGARPYHDYAAMREQLRRQRPWQHRLRGFGKASKLVQRLGHYCYRDDYRATPAPVVLTARERSIAAAWSRRRFVVIEPSTKSKASPSKRWPFERYAAVARALSKEIEVYQIGAKDSPGLEHIPRMDTACFRDVLPYLQAARLYIGPEGGLHHAAAAVGTKAVVIFGGYSPPRVTGYDCHANLTGGAVACGTQYQACSHCVAAMNNIRVDDVLAQARALLHMTAHDQAAAAPAAVGDSR